MLCTIATTHDYAIRALFRFVHFWSVLLCRSWYTVSWCGFVILVIRHPPTWGGGRSQRQCITNHAGCWLKCELLFFFLNVKALQTWPSSFIMCCKTVVATCMSMCFLAGPRLFSLTYCVINCEGVDIVRWIYCIFFLSLPVTVHLKSGCGPLSKTRLSSSDWKLTDRCHNRFLRLLMYFISVTIDIMDGSLVWQHKG